MRRIVVTGANKGIGLAIVEAALSEHEDTFVFLGSRDAGRGETALRRLLEAHPNWQDRLAVLQLDVSRDASVEAAVTAIRDQLGEQASPLYGLVNNAGIGDAEASLRQVLDVNVLGVRRASESFLPLLEPKGGRIVNITSAAGPKFVSNCSTEWQRFFTNPNVEWPELEALLEQCVAMDGDSQAFATRGLGEGDAYGLSKACANSYTLLLARQHPTLRINACTPGFIETDLTRRFATSRGKTPAEVGMQPPKAGARVALFLLFGDPPGNGRYYGSDAQRSPLDRYRAPGTEPYQGP